MSIGVVAGKSLADIQRVVGPPNSVSTVANGKVLYQWMATGYHVALLFKDGICEGVTHESAS